MRKHSEKYKRFQKKVAQDRELRRLIWKTSRKARQSRAGARAVVISRGGIRFKTRMMTAIPLPRVFCLDDNVDATLEAIHRLRVDVLDRAVEVKADMLRGQKRQFKLKRYFDFTTIHDISPSAALVLAAVFQRAKYITGRRIHSVDEHKWRANVTSMLRALGFHELLEMQPFDTRKRYTGNVKIQRFVSGQRADGEELGRLQEALARLLPTELREKLFTAEPYGGMLEAILNSYSWAYPPGHTWEHEALKNWWLTGAVNTKTNQVLVCVYDQGVSIPHSLPRWAHWNAVEIRAKKFMQRLKLSKPIDHFSNDGLAIHLAMKIAKSSTQLPQHGKGLHTMVEVAQRARYGRLRILSRNGEYIWETGKRPRSLTHEFPLSGTLVEWQLEL